jgi:MFS family permease
LGISSQQVGIIGTVYIAGAVLGSLLFGVLAGKRAALPASLHVCKFLVSLTASIFFLTDKFGRKKFFVVTPAIILCSSFATAFSFDYYSFLVCNFFTGIGIGNPLSLSLSPPLTPFAAS